MVLDRFFGNNNNEPSSKFRQLDKDVQREQQEEQQDPFPSFFGRGHDPFFGGKDPFEAMMRHHQSLFSDDRRGMMQRSSRYQVQETKDQYTLSMDVPGVKASDLTLQLVDDAMLCLTGTRKQQTNDNGSKSSMENQFQQCFNLGPVDASRVTADLSDGVLFVSAPKIPQVKKDPVRIPISEGHGRPKL